MADVFCNTSPLQYLYQVGHLELLPTLYERVQVAAAVVEELAGGMRQQVAVPNVEQLPWATTRMASDTSRLISGLGRGEAETIALGLESSDGLVILDDAKARRAASATGLTVIGTVGVLLLAKESGHVEIVRPVLDHLVRLRFRLSERVRIEALTRAGEQ